MRFVEVIIVEGRKVALNPLQVVSVAQVISSKACHSVVHTTDGKSFETLNDYHNLCRTLAEEVSLKS
jgi:hypothetical protein